VFRLIFFVDLIIIFLVNPPEALLVNRLERNLFGVRIMVIILDRFGTLIMLNFFGFRLLMTSKG
jgi:hypothetical protein